MMFDYYENEQIKKENGELKYFKQIKPFTFGKIFSGLVSAKIYGSSVIYFSKEIKNCLGVSDIITIKDLFEAV